MKTRPSIWKPTAQANLKVDVSDAGLAMLLANAAEVIATAPRRELPGMTHGNTENLGSRLQAASRFLKGKATDFSDIKDEVYIDG